MLIIFANDAKHVSCHLYLPLKSPVTLTSKHDEISSSSSAFSGGPGFSHSI